MGESLLLWIIVLVTIVALTMYRLIAITSVQTQDSMDRRAAQSLALAPLFLTAGLISLLLSDSIPIWVRVLGTLSFLKGVFEGYVFCLYMTALRQGGAAVRRVGRWVVLGGGVLAVLDILRWEDSAPLLRYDIAIVAPGLPYYLYYLVLFGSCIALKLLAFAVLIRSMLAQHEEVTYLFRRICACTAFLLAILADGAIVIGLTGVFVWHTSNIRALVNLCFYIMLAVVGTLFLVSVIPQRLLRHLLGPLQRYYRSRRAQEGALLRDLHERLTRLRPDVRLRRHCSATRIMVEIADVRRLLGTNIMRTTPLTPMQEARWIMQYSRQAQPLTPGPYPPFPRVRRPRRYYVQLARAVQTLDHAANPHEQERYGNTP
jgi:hypothetical protein